MATHVYISELYAATIARAQAGAHRAHIGPDHAGQPTDMISPPLNLGTGAVLKAPT